MNKIVFGDCRETMRAWAKDGVKAQMCVTSPPYFGLRDYKVEGQIGLEETPEQYIAAMVEVFRCVWDVLADDGTLWLNIGDSYAANRSYQVPSTKGGNKHSDSQAAGGRGSSVPEGLKQKDLIGIPWMLAFALRAEGWYLRQDIIWSKPNPMPESVKDRCTKSHEYIFLFSKQPKYYFDNKAMQEKAVAKSPAGNKTHRYGSEHGQVNLTKMRGVVFETRNKRSVWAVTTKPFKGAHFATFPPELIEPCVLAGSKVGDIILDPFMGSGTTAGVAVKHGRSYLGCELNEGYLSLQAPRLFGIAGENKNFNFN